MTTTTNQERDEAMSRKEWLEGFAARGGLHDASHAIEALTERQQMRTALKQIAAGVEGGASLSGTQCAEIARGGLGLWATNQEHGEG
jgi:hypothetical protein